MTSEALIRLPAVEELVGLRKSAIYQLIRDGDFPRPVKLGTRASRWRRSDILAWIEDQTS